MPLFRASAPRHARPSKAAPVLALGGLSASFVAVDAAAALGATPDDFARLRSCESGNRYDADTGNGYYGAYQFDLRTWRGLGESGKPSQASPATQDGAAERLQAARGWSPWPSCARRLGLGSARFTEARASRTRNVYVRHAVPAFGGHVLSVADVHAARADVAAWQARMVERGWSLTVDGRFGPRTAAVATRFAAQKKLPAAPGTVDAGVWSAAWALPVT